MSKDIRSFFAPIKSKSADNSKSNKTDERKDVKRHVFNISDSDEEGNFDEKPTLKKPKKESPKRKTDTREKEVVKKTNELEKKKDKKIIDVKDFFGDSPVVQKPQTLIKQVKTNESSPKVERRGKKRRKEHDINKSTEQHFDDDFDATLCLLDEEALGITPSKSSKKADNSCKTTPTLKQSTSEESGRCSDNKLAAEKALLVTPTSKSSKNDDEQAPGQRDEKRKANADAYQRFLSRGGPRNPGSKPIPEGAPNCLQGKSFVITGVLESLDRDEAAELIEKYGGRITSSVSKKTSFVVIGEEPGVSKMKKAEDLKITQISEDGLLDLIKISLKDKIIDSSPKESPYFLNNMKEPQDSTAHTSKKLKKKIIVTTPCFKLKDLPALSDSGIDSLGSEEVKAPALTSKVISPMGDVLWVDKYKPKATKNIIGQTGDKSCVKKLTKWLSDWHKNHGSSDKNKGGRPAPWAQGDDGAYYKAALLSGPPGVGKTTSVHLVCQELGFHIVEFNASDTRSKRLLGEQVAELLASKTIRGFCKGDSNANNYRHVLVMDEVDGMAGNEDRGGVQELIQLIKKSKTPVICMCNDRSHPKMRSLVNYCFDLRYNRPRIEQIKGAMMSICFKEGIKISGDTLVNIISSANQDIRQVLHNLSMWSVKEKSLSDHQTQLDSSHAKKVLKMGPWDVARQVFSKSDQEKMNLRQKEDLFFQDYNLGPLFVQDTYIHTKPFQAKGDKRKTLECLSRAADYLTWGDVIERKIRSQNSWGLLPTQAYFSSVLPGYEMAGNVMGQITFPAWLGKNSKKSRLDRLLQELHVHTRLRTSGSKQAVNLDYSQPLRDAILRPLISEGTGGVADAVAIMNHYHLLREDLDSLIELCHWPNRKDPFAAVDSKVKSAFTRAFNKENAATPYAVIGPIKKSKQDEGELLEMAMDDGGGDADEDADEENDDVATDAMVKKGKSKKEPVKKQRNEGANHQKKVNNSKTSKGRVK